MGNIFTDFKKEIGFTTASIQYLELLLRMAEKNHSKVLEGKKLVETAKEYDLSVSVLPEDYSTRIAKNYIVQINLCVEHFLKNYRSLIGSATYGKTYDNKKDNSLHWTMVESQIDLSMYNQQYRICDYYRIVRNDIIHSLKDRQSTKNAFAAIPCKQIDRLSAPNEMEDLCFDDQVLFARSAQELLKAIYFETEYDWKQIFQVRKADIKKLINKYIDICKWNNYTDNEKAKIMNRVVNYLQEDYPVTEKAKNEIEGLLLGVLA